jgi:APA family basic amino acid/polyamine antiporter
VVSVGSIAAVLTTINGSMAGGTRIAFALSRSRLIPPFFNKVHSKYRSPYTALALTAMLAITLILTRSMDLIVYAITLGYSVTAIAVALSLIRLRKIEPQLYRPFKVPLYPYTSISAIVVLTFMIVTLSIESLILGAVLSLAGLALFISTRKIRGNNAKSSLKKTYN